VIEAQDAFRRVSEAALEGAVRIGLLHSRFPHTHRAELEDYWLERLGPNRPSDDSGSILIATQVVEQSVDIDLDFIVSDLAPTDMLLQRLGRLWRRKRAFRNAPEPEFWVRIPVLSPDSGTPELKTALGRSARVYAPYVLLRTAAVWSGHTKLTLPADIRPLLESTYADPDEGEPAAWGKLRGELEQEKTELEALAEACTRVMAMPMLNDEDDVLTRRSGAPTTPVALLSSIARGPGRAVTVIGLDGTQATITANEWSKPSARFIHRSIVRVPRWMVPDDAPSPAWLTLHGPRGVTVAIVDTTDRGRCAFGDQDSSMFYNPRLGVYAGTPSPPDEFDN
jgi:CRISPR-associated endonuclease/helicase Cas3